MANESLNSGLMETILGSFSPLRLLMHLSGDPSDYHADGDVTVESASTYIHEYFHFLQCLLTAYGHIAWDAHRQSTSFIVNNWRYITAGDPKRGVPIAHAIAGRPERVFPVMVASKTVEAQILTGAARWSLRNPDARLNELGILWFKDDWSANPRVSIGGSLHTLQGKDIIEGHAHYIESYFKEFRLEIDPKDAWSRENVPEIYKIAYDYYLNEIGEEKSYIFPFICDLSVQTSWDPPTPSTEEEWRASSPSWRFVLLTQALKSMPSLHLGEPTDWPSTYNAFASSLFDACGFKSLDQIINERLRAFDRKSELLVLEKLMRSGMKFRQLVPWCGGNPLAIPELWEELKTKFRIPVVQIAGGLGNFGYSDQPMVNEFIAELQFQALAAQIFGDFSNTSYHEQTIECAFGKFGITRGCPYQTTHNCIGRYRPADGPPHPIEVTEDEMITGCVFEWTMVGLGFQSVDIDLNPAAKLPAVKTLK